MEIIGVLGGLFFFILGIIFIVVGFSKFSKYRLIEKTPRTKIGNLTGGLVEIHGVVKPDELMKTPFSGKDCVYCKYEIKEYQQDYDMDEGYDNKWVTIAKGEQRLPFYGKDITGDVRIDSTDADVQILPKTEYHQSRGTKAQKSKLSRALNAWKKGFEIDLDLPSVGLNRVEPSKSWSLQRLHIGDRKYFENFIEPGERLYVIGTALSELNATKDYVIKKGFDEPTFIISNQSEMELVTTFKSRLAIFATIGATSIILGLLVFIFSLFD